MSKTDRSETANAFLATIAGCGRRFFAHQDQVSRFEVDARGRVWFLDSYTGQRIYTHYEGRWRDFTQGGTMRGLVKALRDYIRTGRPPQLSLGPWPDWVCDGDLWGYGSSMANVREAATRLFGFPTQ